VKVGFPNFYFSQSEMFVETMMSHNSPLGLGYQRSKDVADGNIERQVGVACNTLDAPNNTRCSATCGYITPFLGIRRNLQVITNATVSRIVWDDQKKTNGSIVAKQVEYYIDGDGTPKYADVNSHNGGEVILAAGTIGTPKVMELSGVGNSR
jgi:choline dehydrogenase-like flavoprotein